MTSAVLDASAILAVLNDEAGAENVLPLLSDAAVSSVNFAEVVGKLAEQGGSLDQIREALFAIRLDVIDFDISLAERTGMLRAKTRSRGLSLGDRACLALAEREGIPAVTGDQQWLGAVDGIEVHVIR